MSGKRYTKLFESFIRSQNSFWIKSRTGESMRKFSTEQSRPEFQKEVERVRECW